MTPTAPTRTRGWIDRWWLPARRWLDQDNRAEVLGIGALAIACAVAIFVDPRTYPVGLMALPLVIASLVMSPRPLTWFVIFCLVLTSVAAYTQPTPNTDTILRVVVVYLLGFVVMLISFRRTRLGVGGVRGESMFVDLRDRLLRQHQIPDLPAGWEVDHALRTAEGTPYAGDFTIGLRHGPLLQVALVDVSGKGQVAGTRALFLSGAMSGLMGALRPERFLAEANDYLCRQEWEEGFATAVHIAMDLDTGAFEIRSAGHPPALHLHAGSGRWEVCDGDGGPALGLIPECDYPPLTGTMQHGDVLMVYTDGLIEKPGRSLEQGIDRLLGRAERDLRASTEHGAHRLVQRLGSAHDDCALVILRRL